MATRSNRETKPTQAQKTVISLRLIASVVAALLVGVSAGIIIKINEQSMQDSLTSEAQTQLILEARNLAVVSVDPLLSEFPELALMPLAKDILDTQPQLVDVAVIDHQGKIVGTPRPNLLGQPYKPSSTGTTIQGAPPLHKGESLKMIGANLTMVAPVHHPANPYLGQVIISYDTKFIDRKVRASRNAMLKIMLVLLAGAMIFAAGLMSLLFRPLSRLREGLERIGHGDLDSPMHVKDFTELGMLAGTVNTMAKQLKSSQALAVAREQEIVETQKEVVITLGQVVESRSSETANHTIRVGDMSYELALLAGMDKEEAELLRMASPMHDVGKIGIPDRILNKPGKLTAEEYEQMQSHADIGYHILAKSERTILKAAAIIAHQHHERWDGKGYPRGLAGEDIHIFGRIVSLVDVFDAISCDRVYRPAMAPEKVLSIIRAGHGTHFDPELVDLFFANLDRFLAIRDHYQDQSLLLDNKLSPLLGTSPAQPDSAELSLV